GELLLEVLERRQRVLVGAVADLVGPLDRLLDVGFGLLARLADQRVLLKDPARLFVRGADDLVRLALGLQDDFLFVLREPLGLAHLFRHGGADLVEDVDELLLVDQRSRRERQARPAADERLELVEQVQDLDVGPPFSDRHDCRCLGMVSGAAPPAKRLRSARSTWLGTRPLTSPPNLAMSRSRGELRKPYS